MLSALHPGDLQDSGIDTPGRICKTRRDPMSYNWRPYILTFIQLNFPYWGMFRYLIARRREVGVVNIHYVNDCWRAFVRLPSPQGESHRPALVITNRRLSPHYQVRMPSRCCIMLWRKSWLHPNAVPKQCFVCRAGLKVGMGVLSWITFISRDLAWFALHRQCHYPELVPIVSPLQFHH